MNFSLPEDAAQLAARVKRFITEEVIPFEADERWGAHGPSEELRRELNARARAAGVLAPQVSTDLGGHGLSHVGRALVFEAAGYSMLGPVALHCAAPDEGNLHMLDLIANESQRKQWLAPMARATFRSAFAMTEPDGAGSDPALLKTTARPDGDGYVIDGVKWLITGAQDAGCMIVMAAVTDDEGEHQPTMFILEANREGIVLERQLDTMDATFTGGHWVVRFDGVRVRADEILGHKGKALQHAQLRLAPARLTHCMRWLGAAVRAHEIATDYACRRQAFGKPIAEHEGVGFMLADNQIDLHTVRLMIWHTASLLDAGERASSESSMAKVFCSEALARVADRCVQVMGGAGLTRDTPVERFYRDIRAFRIYDGPSEVHRWALAKRLIAQRERSPV